MFNPVIIGIIIVQAIITRINRTAGAIVGLLLTTGIIIWGVGSYSMGNGIALFGIPVDELFFLAACMFWYGMDVRTINQSRRMDAVSNNPAAGISSESRKSKGNLIVVGLFWIAADLIMLEAINIFFNIFNSLVLVRSNPIGIIIYSIYGLIVGLVQWWLVTMVISNTKKADWVGWMLGSTAGWFVYSVILTYAQNTGTVGIFIFMLCGLVVGFLQWLILHKYNRLAIWWIPSCILGWTAQWILYKIGILSVLPFVFAYLLFIFAKPIITCLALMLIIRKQPVKPALEPASMFELPVG